MAKELGFPSPNYIKLVMDGNRNIGLRSIDRLMRGLHLDDKEQEYFSYLVFFCQAKTTVEKNYYYGLMSAVRAPFTASTITTEAYRFYNEWYHCVVRELVVRETPPVDFSAVAAKFRPHITATQVKKSVDLLLELGFIKRNDDGSYTQSSNILTTDREVISIGIRNYHLKMIDFGKESIDTVSKEQREISSLTLCISDEGMLRIKKRIQDFEDEILQIAREDTNVKNVYQVNFQFFPLAGEGK
jgi:uncharacterized protein (TIGR02147 family)